MCEVDEGHRPAVTSARRVVELEREVRELRRGNDILKTAFAFFAAGGARPPVEVSTLEIVAYID